MSQSEIERFQSDIKVKRELSDKVKQDTDQQGLGAIVETARNEGYDFNLEELKTFVIAKSSGSLSDETLARVSAAGSVSTVTLVQTYVQAQVGAEVEIAVVAAVAAVVVAVLV